MDVVTRTHRKQHEKDPEPAEGRPAWDDGRLYSVRPWLGEGRDLPGRRPDQPT